MLWGSAIIYVWLAQYLAQSPTCPVCSLSVVLGLNSYLDLGKMATSAGTTRPLPEETGKALEHSLKHLVDHSEANQRDKSKSGSGLGFLADESYCEDSDPEVDAVHSKGAKSRSWISRFFPSEEMLDEVGDIASAWCVWSTKPGVALRLRAYG